VASAWTYLKASSVGSTHESRKPLAATLNAYDGAITNNMAIVPTTTGSISIFPSNPTHLVLDIFGYFAP